MYCLNKKSVALCAPAVAAATLILPAAAGAAQEVAPVATSTPSAPQGTLPGVVPERFTLAPPAPSPVPTSEPSTPLAPAPRLTPSPRASATPSATERRAPEQVEQSEPRPQPTAESRAPNVPVPVPVDTPMPQAASTPPAVVTPTPEASPSGDVPGWLWALAGGGIVALGLGAHRLFRRRRAGEDDATDVEHVEPEPVRMPRPAPEQAVPAATSTTPVSAVASRTRAIPVQAPQPSAEPFEITLRPQRLAIAGDEVVLELELLLGNRQREAAENVRMQLTMLSANPDQDRHAAAFHAATMLGDGTVPPFDLAPGAGGRIPVRLSLPRQALHVVQLAGRPMFVPMVLVDLRWRSGISIRRFGADFLAGTPGQGDKLGPIWLDRPFTGALTAAPYHPRSAVAA